MLTAGRPVSPPQYGQNPAHYVSSNQSRSMSVPRIYYTRYSPRSYRELSPEATIAYLQFHLAPEYDDYYSSLQQPPDASYQPLIESVGGKTTLSGWEQIQPGAVSTRPSATYSTPSRQQQPPSSAGKQYERVPQPFIDQSSGYSSRLGVSMIAGGLELSTRNGSANQRHLASGGLSQRYQAQGAPVVKTSQVPAIAVQQGHANDPIQAGRVSGNVPRAIGAVKPAEKQPSSPHRPASADQQRIGSSQPQRSYYAEGVPQQALTPKRQPSADARQADVNYHGQIVGQTALAQCRPTQALSTAPHPSIQAPSPGGYTEQAAIAAASQQPFTQKPTSGGHSQQAAITAGTLYPSAQKPISGGYSQQAAITAGTLYSSAQKPTSGSYSQQAAIEAPMQHPSTQKPTPGGYSQQATIGAALQSQPAQRPSPGGHSQQATIEAASKHPSAQRPTTGEYSLQAAIAAAPQHPSAQRPTSEGYSQQAVVEAASQQPFAQKPTPSWYSQQTAVEAASQQVRSQSPNQQYSTPAPQHQQGMVTMMSRAGDPSHDARADQYRPPSGLIGQAQPAKSPGWVVDKQIVTAGRAPSQPPIMGTSSQQAPVSEGNRLSRLMEDAPATGISGAQGIPGGRSIPDGRQRMMTGGQPSPPKIGQASNTRVGGIYGPGWVLDEKIATAAQRQPLQYNQISTLTPAASRQSRLDQGTAKATTNRAEHAQHRSLSLPRIYYTRYSPRSYRELSPQATVAYLQYQVPMIESDY